jgi:hypothetical protein
MIGYELTADDDGSRMFDVGESSRERCPTCGRPWDESAINPVYVPRKRRRDALATIDGRLIVSDRLAGDLRDAGATLIALPATDRFFELRSEEVVVFDAQRAGTRCLNRCAICERYFDVVGAYPIILRPPYPNPLPDRVVRTDLQFASGEEQHPLFLVGPNLGQRLLQQEFAGLELQPIKG